MLEFNDFKIRQRPSDGYIHATDMCKVNPKKKWNDYYRSKNTKDFIQELILTAGIPANRIITGKGGRYGGTWIHPRIAINLAQWISPQFAVKVTGWVDKFIRGDVSIIKDIIQNHDNVNNTESLVSITSVLKTDDNSHKEELAKIT